jgi:hypothetical protein
MLGLIAARKIGPSLSDGPDREWNLGDEQTSSTGYGHTPRHLGELDQILRFVTTKNPKLKEEKESRDKAVEYLEDRLTAGPIRALVTDISEPKGRSLRCPPGARASGGTETEMGLRQWRPPMGKLNGTLKDHSGADLGAIVITRAITATGPPPGGPWCSAPPDT